MKILTLFFTYGISIEDWTKNGSMDREINIYKKFLNYFDKIYLITYGGNDYGYANKLPENIIILPKKINLNNAFYSLLIPFIYKKEIRESTWLKTNQLMGSWSAVLSKLLFNKKLALRTGYTESLSFIGKNFLKKKIIIMLEFIAYKLATFSIVTSQRQQKYISNKYKTQNTYVIPNGIDTQIFKPTSKKIISKKIKILFVGRLHPEKNLLNLIMAIKDFADLEFKIIGKGTLEKDILNLKNKHNLDIQIISHISNSKLPQIYNQADIYVQPSLYEGNPKTILEAMACGLPVIGTNVQGINDLIIHNQTGYLCETSPDSIKDAVFKLKNDAIFRKNLGLNASRYIKNFYDLNDIIKKELNIYKQI